MEPNTDGIRENTFDASHLGIPIRGILDKEKRYSLTPLEHRIISESESSYYEWSKRFLLISLGLFFTVVSNFCIFISLREILIRGQIGIKFGYC